MPHPKTNHTFKHIWFPNRTNPTRKKPKELELSYARQNNYIICTIQNDNLYLTDDVK